MSKMVLEGMPPSVLVVDDDEFSQDVLSALLHDQGVSDVHTACNGRDALRTLARMPHPPEVLICDVFMPDMDGIEFLDQLGKRHFEGSVILVSGMNIEMLEIARDVAVNNGLKVLGAFVKPLHRDVLAQALECMVVA